ncbi:50S ribosomal protein L6 [Parachitinimonas caeni]|uniref:Large ribosomal subunit protein uL6 n=1 Tax=Parachitinimonas caeni TaxID=3031301 RepID=A0ABT7E4S3_9NEIS|nr:50S ribosomal protein L6 [Parachitinimonas caeni]MDK2126368.1 50S ribosomal protein L6 [Parachitinimonas caeni]
MSRVAKNPITIPGGVEVSMLGKELVVKGPLGMQKQVICDGVSVTVETGVLKFFANSDDKHARAMSGTLRALAANMVVGVSKGFERKLNLVGVGYRAQAQGDVVNLTLGFSHPVAHRLPVGVKAETPSQTEIVLKGINRQQIGQVAAEIRAYRPPEPYKGKGVRYSDEIVVLKETKKK